MTFLRRFLRRLAAPFRSSQAEHDLAREIRSHLQLLEDRFLAQGMSPEDARFAAQCAFGGVEQAKEHQRDTRSFRWIDDSRIDFKYGGHGVDGTPSATCRNVIVEAFMTAGDAARVDAGCMNP